MGVTGSSANVKFWHRLSTAVVFDNTSGSRCRTATDRIWQQPKKMLPFVDWLIQDDGFVRKFVILCRLLIFIALYN